MLIVIVAVGGEKVVVMGSLGEGGGDIIVDGWMDRQGIGKGEKRVGLSFVWVVVVGGERTGCLTIDMGNVYARLTWWIEPRLAYCGDGGMASSKACMTSQKPTAVCMHARYT